MTNQSEIYHVDQPSEKELQARQKKDFQTLETLHPGNRFRLMFGQPLLPQPPDNKIPVIHE